MGQRPTATCPWSGLGTSAASWQLDPTGPWRRSLRAPPSVGELLQDQIAAMGHQREDHSPELHEESESVSILPGPEQCHSVLTGHHSRAPDP